MERDQKEVLEELANAQPTKRQGLQDVLRDNYPDTYAVMSKLVENGDALDFQLEIIEPAFDKSGTKPHVNFIVFFMIGPRNGEGKQDYSFFRYGSGRDMGSFKPDDLNNFIQDCLVDYIKYIEDQANEAPSNPSE